MAARKKSKSKPRPRGAPKAAPRSPATIDHEQRSRHAEKLLVKQMPYRAVSEAVMSKFKVCQRTASSDIALAYERIRISDDAERPHRKQIMRSTWKRQYELAMAAGKLNSANRALIELGRLDGLYDPKRIEFSGNVGVSVTQRVIVDALNEEGLAALDTVLAQLEAAGVRMLPAGDAPTTPIVEADVVERDASKLS